MVAFYNANIYLFIFSMTFIFLIFFLSFNYIGALWNGAYVRPNLFENRVDQLLQNQVQTRNVIMKTDEMTKT